MGSAPFLGPPSTAQPKAHRPQTASCVSHRRLAAECILCPSGGKNTHAPQSTDQRPGPPSVFGAAACISTDWLQDVCGLPPPPWVACPQYGEPGQRPCVVLRQRRFRPAGSYIFSSSRFQSWTDFRSRLSGSGGRVVLQPMKHKAHRLGSPSPHHPQPLDCPSPHSPDVLDCRNRHTFCATRFGVFGFSFFLFPLPQKSLNTGISPMKFADNVIP